MLLGSEEAFTEREEEPREWGKGGTYRGGWGGGLAPPNFGALCTVAGTWEYTADTPISFWDTHWDKD